ncbi:MAG TPA: heme o synthase [Vicinamibacterales bacterium]|jgi:protoheme IX farnesyltransferase
MNDPASPSVRPRAIALSLPVPRVSSRASDFLALTKPRLNFLVVATTLSGYYLAADQFSPVLLLHTVVGTALVAGGAAAFNEIFERDTDGLMRRTRNRPLPGGRMRVSTAAWFAVAISAIGLVQLVLGANLLAAGIAAVTLISYTLVYTPLKGRTSLATLVGGIPGGLPPMIGWAAARGSLSVDAWVLFAIVFFWQMPHFLAIAWLCREDYARAGLPMLPVVEPDGRSTGLQAVLYAAVLVPVSLMPTLTGLTGRVYFVVAAILGLGFLALAVQFAGRRTNEGARRLFLGSISYLPLLWALMLGNHL